MTINSGGTPCASEKQYIANAYQQLPSFFVDHSQSAGLKNSIQINSSWEGMTETVQIFMRFVYSFFFLFSNQLLRLSQDSGLATSHTIHASNTCHESGSRNRDLGDSN